MRNLRCLRLTPFVLLAFTNPQGETVYIDSGSVVSVARGVGTCAAFNSRKGTKISWPESTYLDLGGYGYCVKESVEEAVGKIKANEKESESKGD